VFDQLINFKSTWLIKEGLVLVQLIKFKFKLKAALQ